MKVMPKGTAAMLIDALGNLGGTLDTTYATTYSYYPAGATPSIPLACTGGSTVQQAPDQAQLLKSSSTHGIAALTSVYDNAGRPLAISNGKGPVCRSYTNEGRLSSTHAPGDGQATVYAYDPAGNRLIQPLPPRSPRSS